MWLTLAGRRHTHTQQVFLDNFTTTCSHCAEDCTTDRHPVESRAHATRFYTPLSARTRSWWVRSASLAFCSSVTNFSSLFWAPFGSLFSSVRSRTCSRTAAISSCCSESNFRENWTLHHGEIVCVRVLFGDFHRRCQATLITNRMMTCCFQNKTRHRRFAKHDHIM